MILSSILNDGFGLLSKQLRFYCWHFRRNLDHKNRQELIDLLHEQQFESLANKIRALDNNAIQDCKQQVGKLLFDYCLSKNRRNQLVKLIESNLVDVNVRLDNYGRTLLHRCAYNLDVELVKILVNHGVNIRLRDYAGNTALHIAIQSYRNGTVLYASETKMMQNLVAIIELLLEADKTLLKDRLLKRKRGKITEGVDNEDDVAKLPFKSIKVENNSDVEDTCLRSSSVGVDNSSDECFANNTVCNGRGKSELEFSTSKWLKSHNIDHSKRAIIPNLSTWDNSTLDTSHSGSSSTALRASNQALEAIHSLILEDYSTPLIDTKNAFGRTPLHYCVLVVGDPYMMLLIQILIKYGADIDPIDNRMRTPLYCLVQRHNFSSIRHRLSAIRYLIKIGCDDVGLAIDGHIDSILSDQLIENLEKSTESDRGVMTDSSALAILTKFTPKRVPTLKHLTRVKMQRFVRDLTSNSIRQISINLPITCPQSLNRYINRHPLY